MTPKEKIIFCRRAGIQMKDLATQLGVSRQFIHKVLHDQRILSPEKKALLDSLLQRVTQNQEKDNKTEPINDTCISPTSSFCNCERFQQEVLDRLSSIEQLLIKVLGRDDL